MELLQCFKKSNFAVLSLACGGLFPFQAAAQFAPDADICLPGQEIYDLSFEEVTPTYEAGITVFGGKGVTVKIPKKQVIYKGKCRDIKIPKPPKPPKKTQQYWDLFSLAQGDLPFEDYQFSRADLFYTAVNLPSGIAEISSPTATFELQAIKTSGETISAVFGMIRDGNGFRFANPGAVDFWAATSGRSVLQMTWQVTGIQVTSTGYGAGAFGVSHFHGGVPLNAYSAILSVSAPSTGVKKVIIN